MIYSKRQMSDSYLIAMLLAIVGGFLDAYTYVARGGVFANAQTGNIVLFGLHLAEKKWRFILLLLLMEAIIYILAPIDTENKRLSKGEKNIIKKCVLDGWVLWIWF